MGLKKKLMMQAAAAAAAEAAEGGGAAAADSNTVWRVGDDDALWRAQQELAKEDASRADADADADALAVDLDAAFRPPPAAERDGGGGGNVDGAGGTSSAAGGKYKWATSLDTQFVFAFANAVPKRDVGAMCWGKDVVGVMRSDAGAEGVFFVQTSDGAVVIKGSRSMGPEVFSSLLGSLLGVYCPPWRVVATASPEGKAMLAGLSAKDASGRVKLNLGSLTHVLVKGFVPGATVGDLGRDRAAEIFGAGGLSANGRRRLREIGRILALDVLCNNGDRFPLIWDNRGNPGNVMLARGPGVAVSIDSQIQPVDGKSHPEQLAAYLDKVRGLAQGLRERSEADELPEFKRVREKLLEFSSYDVGSEGTVEMQRGYMEVSGSKDRFDVSKARLDAWRDATLAWDPPLVGAAGIDTSFVVAVWELL